MTCGLRQGARILRPVANRQLLMTVADEMTTDELAR
jgi:hypothetical protein